MVRVTNTAHVMDRIAERIADPSERQAIYASMLRHAATLAESGVHSVAVRFYRGKFHGREWKYGMSDTGSNGDCATFVMRDDTIVTFMWRRAAQPHLPHKYNVQHTRCVKSACTGEGPSHVHA